MARMLDKGDGMKKTIEITKDANGVGAFHCAASYGRTDICRYLIEELGFDPDFRSDQGRTLFYAAIEGKTGSLTYLCNCGADPTCTDRKGDTPLHYAAQCGKATLLNSCSPTEFVWIPKITAGHLFMLLQAVATKKL